MQNGYLAVAGLNKSLNSRLEIWDIHNVTLIKILKTYEWQEGIVNIDVLKNGYLAVSLSNRIEIWNADNSTLIKILKQSSSFENIIALKNNNYLLVYKSLRLENMLKVELWNTDNSSLVKNFTFNIEYSEQIRL